MLAVSLDANTPYFRTNPRPVEFDLRRASYCSWRNFIPRARRNISPRSSVDPVLLFPPTLSLFARVRHIYPRGLMEIRRIMRTIFHLLPNECRDAIVHDAITRGNLAESSGGSPRPPGPQLTRSRSFAFVLVSLIASRLITGVRVCLRGRRAGRPTLVRRLPPDR